MTKNQKAAIKLFELSEVMLSQAKNIRNNVYGRMLEDLGSNADCELCGNMHWPLCKENFS